MRSLILTDMHYDKDKSKKCKNKTEIKTSLFEKMSNAIFFPKTKKLYINISTQSFCKSRKQ